MLELLQSMHFFMKYDLNSLLVFINYLTCSSYGLNEVIQAAGQPMDRLLIVFEGVIEVVQVEVRSQPTRRPRLLLEGQHKVYQYKPLRYQDGLTYYCNLKTVRQINEGGLCCLEALLPEFGEARCPATVLASSRVMIYELSREGFAYLPITYRKALEKYLRGSLPEDGIFKYF